MAECQESTNQVRTHHCHALHCFEHLNVCTPVFFFQRRARKMVKMTNEFFLSTLQICLYFILGILLEKNMFNNVVFVVGALHPPTIPWQHTHTHSFVSPEKEHSNACNLVQALNYQDKEH